MSSMALNIVMDVCKNMRETGSMDLVVTTGECIRKMWIDDANLDDKAMYLLHTHTEGELRGKVKSYYKLDFSEEEMKHAVTS